ncbi:hypothetical protein, partial [uncultured Sulfitobacter sp.]|uniref:hypothetical protein n=1 Tax=uncultured Sulfitobacter sp. TaxID=191468 RepID=UPI0030DC3294
MTRQIGNRLVTVDFSGAVNVANESGGTADVEIVFGAFAYSSVADTTPPTISIGAFTDAANGNQTVEITLSEASTDFAVGDLTLT